MVQILPAVQKIPKRTFAQKLNEGIGPALEVAQEFYSKYQDKKAKEAENESLMKNLGINVSGLSPEMRKLVVSEHLKGQNSLSLQDKKNLGRGQAASSQENNDKKTLSNLNGAMSIIDEMENIGKKGNLGIGTTFQQAISPDAREDASKYEMMGKSLISYATNIPIRNKIEFEVLAEKLYDPSISDSGRKGILDAMRKIIQNSMKAYETEIEEDEIGKPNKKRPPLESFMR